MLCEWCKKELTDKQCKEKRRFCSTSCSAKWRTSNFDYHKRKSEKGKEALSEAMKKKWQDSKFRENNRNRMKENNPSRLPDYRDKVIKTMLSRGGYPNNFVAGNGKISRVEQIIYQELIHRGFNYNYAIPTGEAIRAFPEKNYAKNYKPDFTLIKKKICVEIDGPDHDKEADAKKDACLNFLGFRVCRFTNSQVQEDLEGVLEEVDKIVRENSRD